MKIHALRWDLVHDFIRTQCGFSATRFHVNNVTWERRQVTCKNCLKTDHKTSSGEGK